jgi:hypothetical protein
MREGNDMAVCEAVKCNTSAEKHLRDAINSLQRIVVDRCPVTIDLDLDTLRSVYHDMLKVRDRAIIEQGWTYEQ